ncbi:cell wall-binding repeat-containing protein [Desulfitobacterium metallireducens]|uniref:Cell wall-binding protein n=1 Tax=Desulfitobacterium metallireducens DSM 15288 TaxID=871968 RepID=W0ECV2_9FIRM|nr:cell wall-binding repeat-containing protein [Desulfitobacterium metallireducens]AHF08675.1 hypothetical protein DESME_14170 [Desulfitobacterium metallireducens DSM 15288]
MKKILGVLLTLAMSLALPLSAAASTTPTQTQQVRLQGSNRYETAVSIANELAKQHNIDFSKGEKFQNVVLASGNNFPDALAGAPLANQENAPILLVDNTPENSTTTFDFIQAHVSTSGNVFLLGGTGVIPQNFTDKLVSMGFAPQNIEQLGGQNRNETSLIISKRLQNPLKEVVLVTDSYFADALTVAPTATSVFTPILLVADTGLTPDQKAFCDSINNVVIFGTLASKTNEIYPRAMGLTGANKYDSNAIWAKQVKNKPFIALATGEDYPDALAGAVLVGSLGVGGGVVLMTNPNQLPSETISALNVISYNDKQALTYTNAQGQYSSFPAVMYPTLYILGGTGAVSDSVQSQAATILNGPGTAK